MARVAIAIVDRQELLLVRTLDHPDRTEVDAVELAAHLYPSMVFFEDTFGTKIDSILLAGLAGTNGLCAALQQETNVRTEEMAFGIHGVGSGLGEPVSPSALTGLAGALLH